MTHSTKAPQEDTLVSLSQNVKQALQSNQPIVALESTIFSHGLPAEESLELATRACDLLMQMQVTPAIVGLLQGQIIIGLTYDQLVTLTSDPATQKVAARDLAYAMQQKLSAGTTVSATAACAYAAGISVFATGGIGGVHRGPFDVSSDLWELSQTPIITVSSGCKSILDVPATYEALESLGIPILAYQTSSFPGFHYRNTGLPLAHRIETPTRASEIFALHRRLGRRQSLLIANPIPESSEIPRVDIEGWLEAGLVSADQQGIRAKEVTPFLLSYLAEQSKGKTVTANKALFLNNVLLAGEIAREWHRASRA